MLVSELGEACRAVVLGLGHIALTGRSEYRSRIVAAEYPVDEHVDRYDVVFLAFPSLRVFAQGCGCHSDPANVSKLPHQLRKQITNDHVVVDDLSADEDYIDGSQTSIRPS